MQLTELSKAGRLPSFDGWRAVSILMVLVAHSQKSFGFPASSAKPLLNFIGGDLGVRFFFVISGFLITWLILAEFGRSGTVSLKNFYIRRAFRILPVSMGFLIVLFFLQLTTPFHQTLAAWIANLTFTTNYVPVPWPTNHLWSLAVEEQFYLLWPFLFVFLSLGSNFNRALKVLAVPLFAAPILRIVAYKHYYFDSVGFLFGHSSFLRYFDALAIGCLCAMVVAGFEQKSRALIQKYFYFIPIAALVMLCEPILLKWLHAPGRIAEAVDYTFQEAGFSLLLVQSILFPKALGYIWLSWRPIRYIGILSYSLYIWQEILCSEPSTFGWGKVWWTSFPGWWVAALVVAVVSYYGLECPFLKIRARFRGNNQDSAAASGRRGSVNVGSDTQSVAR